MFEILNPDTHIDFISLRKYAFVVSTALIVTGLVSLVAHGGPNYGIDFTGGIMLHVGVDSDVTTAEIRDAISDLDVGDVAVQQFEGQSGEYMLRIPTVDDAAIGGGTPELIKTRLQETFGQRGFEQLRTEIVGPRVGRELRMRGILSVLFATLVMGLYIAFRFELRFGIGAGLALLHDVLVTIGALSLYGVEVNLSVVAALLTVVGYSVNDTVVVSDRIRENMHRDKRTKLSVLINSSINETLSRTLLTTGTSLMVLGVLFFLGGGVIHAFAFTLIVGLTAGTYSSIFIASPVVEMWGETKTAEG